MPDDHLTCPKCGYDLYGIPAIRCPECGFRYDSAALRSLAAEADWIRLAAAQDVTRWAAVGGFLTLPVACEALGFELEARLVVMAVVATVTFFTWARITESSLLYVPYPAGKFLPLVPALGGLAVAAVPGIALAGAGLTIAYAWIIRFRDWPALAPESNVRSAELRRMVLRWSSYSMLILWIATVLLLLPFVV